MDDLTASRSLLLDAFERVHEGVRGVTDGLSQAAVDFRPDPGANPIGWLVWHLSRVQDDHVAELAGVGQVWPRWRERFALPFEDPDATGYGMSADEVGQVHVSAELLLSYHDEVHQLTVGYLQDLTAGELERVVDERWDPPVTAAVRLLSVFEDAAMHLGQAGYVRGVHERSAGGSS
jgi:Protein of unknown function (DUF664)